VHNHARKTSIRIVFAVIALLAAAPISAGDPTTKKAKNEIKWGIEAARRGYWLEALNRFQRADTLVPNRVNVLNNIAVALEASGRYEDALLAYETALKVAPNDRVVRRNFTQFKEFYDSYVAPIPVDEPVGEGSDEASDEASEEGTDKGEAGDEASSEGGEGAGSDGAEGSADND
jgi:tetratricopeptide (TPR) repeat protein